MNVTFRIVILFLALIASINTNAQLCQGSLGDPVVNLTFGSGANFGPALGSSITNYTYASSSCPSDGLYIISNNLPSCFSSTWHELREDHTPNDTDGYMMVVNSSNNPGDFYVQQINGLCSGTTYQFAAWVVNVLKPTSCNGAGIKPKLTFKIETISGTVLLSSSTGDIASDNTPVWNQYGAFFTLPSGTSSVILRMTNDGVGGCGNDLALDDITFRPCGALVTASVNGSATSKEYCTGEITSNVFTATTATGSSASYQWQTSIDNGSSWTDIPGATTKTYTTPNITTAGTYLYRFSVAEGSDISITACRIVSNVLTITVHPNPTITLDDNLSACEGDTVTFSANGGTRYRWTGPLNYSSDSVTAVVNNAAISSNGKYVVTVTSDKGCIAKDSLVLTINKKPVVNITSANASYCEGGSVLVNATGTDVATWSWFPVTGLSAGSIPNPVASPATTTTYTLRGSNGICIGEDSIKITVFNKPKVNAGPDKQVFEGQSVILNGTVTGEGVTFAWTPAAYLNNAALPQPTATPPNEITYTLTANSTEGCGAASDNVVVKVYKNIVIPNAFSPNNDGVNDTWRIQFLEFYPAATLEVFNRYGRKVYSKNLNYQPWDGTSNNKPLPPGTYYYTLDLKVADLKYSGWLLLMK